MMSREAAAMPTLLEVDEGLSEEATQATGLSSKAETIEAGLQRVLLDRTLREFRELRGAVEFWPEVLEERRRAWPIDGE